MTAAGVTIAVMLSGCSVHVNAGSAGATKAEQALSEIDGVRSVSGLGTNNLPFAGTVSAFVVTDDDPAGRGAPFGPRPWRGGGAGGRRSVGVEGRVPVSRRVERAGVISSDDSADDGAKPDPSAYVEANRVAQAADRPGVAAIVVAPNRVTVTADGADNALSAATSIAAASPTAPVTSLEVGSSKAAMEDRGENGLLLRGSPSRFGDSVTVGRQLTRFLPARVSLFDANATVTVTVTKVDDASALAAALKPVLPDGTRLAVGIAGQPSETSADLTLRDGALGVDALRSESQRNDTRTRLGDAVRDAWNG